MQICERGKILKAKIQQHPQHEDRDRLQDTRPGYSNIKFALSTAAGTKKIYREARWTGMSALAESGRDADMTPGPRQKSLERNQGLLRARREILTGKRAAGLQTEGSQTRKLVRDFNEEYEQHGHESKQIFFIELQKIHTTTKFIVLLTHLIRN
jgi:hypothetical protein